MAHEENVEALAAKYGLPNPILHEQLKVRRVDFLDRHGEILASIEGTPMNCASRLWVHDMAETYGSMIHLDPRTQRLLQAFFAERWDGDWAPEHRPMMYWFANAYYAMAIYD